MQHFRETNLRYFKPLSYLQIKHFKHPCRTVWGVYGDREIMTKKSQTFWQNKLFLNPLVLWTVEKAMQSLPLKNQNKTKNLFWNLVVKTCMRFSKTVQLLQSICYTLYNTLQIHTRNSMKNLVQKVLEITVRIWLLSSGVIFLHVTFYWSRAVLLSSQGFSRTYFCWHPTLPLLGRAQWHSQSAAFLVVF